MKKIILAILLIFITTGLSAKKFVVGINPWLHFITYENEIPGGKTVRIFKQIAKEMNYEIEFKVVPWARSVKMMQTGEIDAMGNLSYSKKREKFLEFVKPSFYKQSTFFYTLKENKDIIKKYEDLYNYSIPVSLGYVYYKQFDEDKNIKKEIVSHLEENTPEFTIIKMLLKKRVKVIISSSGVMEYLSQRYNLHGLFEPTIYNPKISDNLYIGVSKKSPFIKDIDKINEVMKKLINK